MMSSMMMMNIVPDSCVEALSNENVQKLNISEYDVILQAAFINDCFASVLENTVVMTMTSILLTAHGCTEDQKYRDDKNKIIKNTTVICCINTYCMLIQTVFENPRHSTIFKTKPRPQAVVRMKYKATVHPPKVNKKYILYCVQVISIITFTIGVCRKLFMDSDDI